MTYYISDTQEVLFFFFGIISLALLQRSKNMKGFIVTSLCLLASLLSKETGILFIFITILYYVLFKFKRNTFLQTMICLITPVGLYALLRVSHVGILSHAANNTPMEQLSLIHRMMNMPEMIFFYLKTFLFPVNLAASYHWFYTYITFRHFLLPLLIDLLFFAGMILFGFFLYKNRLQKYFTYYFFFSSWFFSGLLFHLQLLPLDQTVAERWFYFPIVGILGMIGVILEIYKIQLKHKYVGIPIVIILVLLASRTFVRSFDWKDDFTNASHDIRVSKKAYDLENSLASYYLNQGNYTEAKKHVLNSIHIFPYITNYTNLGVANVHLHKYKEAQQAYQKALQYGDYYMIYENLAGLGTIYGNPNLNIVFIKKKALIKYPQDSKLWMYLAVLEYNQGNKIDALRYIKTGYQYSHENDVIYVYTRILNNQPLNALN